LRFEFTGNSFKSESMKDVLLEVIHDAHSSGANIRSVVQDMGPQNIATLKKLGIVCTKKQVTYKVSKFKI
jgi:hypothetical protein